jgi:hypothetical protein
MVVEAEKFSIYTIVKASSSVWSTIIITYDANWWKFTNWIEDISSVNIVYKRIVMEIIILTLICKCLIKNQMIWIFNHDGCLQGGI